MFWLTWKTEGKVALTRVGTCVIDASAGSAEAQARVQVLPAALTVVASDQSALFGAPIPAPAYSFQGLVNGDTPTCATAPAPNYTLMFASGWQCSTPGSGGWPGRADPPSGRC